MKLKSKFGLAGAGILLLVLAACGGDGLFNLGQAAADGDVNEFEANSLLLNTTSTGEPDNVSNFMLVTSETDEPFDLAD